VADCCNQLAQDAAHALSFLRTMNPGTTASLICPACGQAFLSMQQSMEGMVQCPHCAHNALRGYFGTQAQVAGVAQVRRRVAQSQPLQNLQPPAPDPHPYSQPAAWPAMQPQPVQPPAPAFARPPLQYSQALMPTGAPPPQPDEFVTPPHLRTSPWRNAFILLAFTVVCGGALWMWWDSVNTPAAKPAGTSAPSPSKVEVPRPPFPPQVQVARALIPEPDMGAFSADAKALVNELFAADTPARRAACIHDASKYTAEIEALLGSPATPKVEPRMLSPISGMPLLLPGGQPVPLFKLVTSTCATGALVRLETGADGKRRISWPLLHETHASTMAAFVKQPAAEAAWFHMGLRPNHGLDISAELRSKYLTFDVQVSAGGVPHFVACVERDSPLGRFMDRETEWGKAYLARLLVRKLDIKADAPCVLVIDCEGSPER
jgi:DNA-directed RNA polymerase subunit RPC12/RpoP